MESSISSKLFFLEVHIDRIDPVLLQEATETKLTVFILDGSINSKLFNPYTGGTRYNPRRVVVNSPTSSGKKYGCEGTEIYNGK